MRILLIRLRLIGDVVFTTPAIAALRKRFPDAHISYLVEPSAAPVVQHNPHIDEVIIAERPRGVRRLLYDWRLARSLRTRRFDLVIDFHGGPRSSWLTWATGAPRRIGYAVPGRGWMYTTRIPWTRALVPPRHSVANQWDLLHPLGIEAADRLQHPTEMRVDSAVESSVLGRLAAAGIESRHEVIVIHVSAGNPFRRWPADRFSELAARLAHENRERRIIISSGPSETAAADHVAAEATRRAGDAAPGIVRCGEFNLPELRALVARAALYIGGDTGPMHIASTTQTPIVALFGPTLPERSLPWRDPAIRSIGLDAGKLPCRPCHQRHCVPGDFRCLTGITVDAVHDAAQEILGSR